MDLSDWLRLAGLGQFSILIASSIVPFRLNWKQDLASLPTLHRQMYWTYGGYVVLGIVALAGMCVWCAEELASGSRLGRAVCAYGAVFWGVRLSLQAVFDVTPFLTATWLRLGYHTLTGLFLFFTIIYLWAAFQ